MHIAHNVVYLMCSKSWRVVQHSEQTEKLENNELKIDREAWLSGPVPWSSHF